MAADVQREVGQGAAYLAWVYLKAIMQAAVEDKRLFRNPCKGNSTIKPPNTHIMIRTGNSQYRLRTRMKRHNSNTIDIGIPISMTPHRRPPPKLIY